VDEAAWGVGQLIRMNPVPKIIDLSMKLSGKRPLLQHQHASTNDPLSGTIHLALLI